VRKSLVIVVVVFLSVTAEAAPPDQKDTFEAAFERLKGLAGTWESTKNDAEVRYYLTGNSSAVVEVFKNSTSSVYHMDGDDLLVTHYCGANNQPRMKAVDYDPERGTLKFDFVDVTNVADPDEYYTREVEIVFQDESHVEVHFNGIEKGHELPVVQPLRRRRAGR